MRPSSLSRSSRGFTLIETLTALMIVSSLVRIGMPNLQEVRLRAEATRIAGEFNVVRQAAYDYVAEHHSWPPEFGPGQIPPELAHHLPEGFSFRRGRYELDWQNWGLPSGLPSRPEVRNILGLSIVTEDRALGAALEEILGSSPGHFSLGGSYTFLLEVQ